MTTIAIKGAVVDDETGAFYKFFGMPAANPKMVADAIESDTDGELTVQIASNGGDVFAASEIYTQLKQFDGQVNVEIQGLAASAASVIAMAGDNIKMSPTASMMIHKAWSGVQGNADDMAHQSEVLDSIDKSIVSAYEAKTGLSDDELLNLMSKETWMNAKEAVDKGFADEVMYFDEHTPAFSNSLETIVPKSAVNKLLNLISKTTDQEPIKTKNSLRQRKLAILMSKKED